MSNRFGTACKEGYRVASKSITVKESAQLSGQQNITATAVLTGDAPKAPGFNSVFSVIALTVIIVLIRGERRGRSGKSPCLQAGDESAALPLPT